MSLLDASQDRVSNLADGDDGVKPSWRTVSAI
jgi:hypothetical protein